MIPMDSKEFRKYLELAKKFNVKKLKLNNMEVEFDDSAFIEQTTSPSKDGGEALKDIGLSDQDVFWSTDTPIE